MPIRSSLISSASSSDQLPGPTVPSTTPHSSSVITYSYPSPLLKMKNPFLKWLAINATAIVPTTPAATKRRQQAEHERRSPAAISVRLASHACSIGIRIPIDAEPTRRAGDLAAAEDVPDAVGEHHGADTESQQQQGEIDRVRVAHRARRYARRSGEPEFERAERAVVGDELVAALAPTTVA